jgi:hypothetical protein
MDLDEARLRMVPDGGIMFVLDNGIAIQRRRKHEPIPGMDDLGKEDLEREIGRASRRERVSEGV